MVKEDWSRLYQLSPGQFVIKIPARLRNDVDFPLELVTDKDVKIKIVGKTLVMGNEL